MLVRTLVVCDVPIAEESDKSSNPVPLLPRNVPTGSAADFSPLVGALGDAAACK